MFHLFVLVHRCTDYTPSLGRTYLKTCLFCSDSDFPFLAGNASPESRLGPGNHDSHHSRGQRPNQHLADQALRLLGGRRRHLCS